MKLLQPHITEKTYQTIEGSNNTGSTYTFKVKPDLSKEQIKKLVEKEYKVAVTSVQTITLPGKVRRFKGILGHTSILKKAVVRLKKGDRIAAFDIEDTNQTDEKE